MYKREIIETVKLSVPIVIAQLGVILMGVTDNIMVGRFLGAVPLGAAGLANSLSFLVLSIGFGGLGVVASLISQAKGQGNDEEIGQLFKIGIRVALLLGVVLGGIGVAVAFGLEIFGQTPQITRLTRPFMLILSVSTVPLLLFIAARQLSDGLSFTRVAMFVTVTALLVNLFFNWVLINGIWLFPKLGLNGSATATLISRCYMAVAIVGYIYQSSFFKKYLPSTAQKTVKFAQVLQVLKLTVSTGFQFFFEIASFSLAVVMIGWLGEAQLAAHQIAINMASTTYMMATGIAAAAAIRVGRAYGEQDLMGVRRAATSAFGLVAVFMGLCGIIFLTSNEWLVSLYLTDNFEVMGIAASLVILAAFFQLSDGVQVVALGTLRGITDVNVPTVITLIAYWGIALPVSYLLAFPFRMDIQGVWIGLSLGLTFSAVFLTFRFYRLLAKKRKDETVLMVE